jgi:uncharacterized protein YndB with AHSA1/START domain
LSYGSKGGGTRTTRIIAAPRETVYRALIDPTALVAWRVPGDMTATVHDFDARIGGGYTMSLFYPDSEPDERGKTGGREDRFTARYVELSPLERVVEAITFESADAAFAGEMTMTVELAEFDGGTEVTITFIGLPPGVRPEDNDAGTQSALEKLAHYVE